MDPVGEIVGNLAGLGLGDGGGEFDAYGQSDAHSQNAKELLQVGRMDEALDSLGMALEVARTIPDEGMRFQRFLEISQQLAEMGQQEEAIKIVNEALVIADRIEDDYWKSEALCTISKQFVNMREFNKAVAIANRIPHEDLQRGAFSQIPIPLVERHDR